ncbi:hypothetical protein [Streptomyces sp. NPDC049879]|uniref:hypothetical protein n=1 Tax=Streptomyces sp. NPDC049879 TaxID=3365598 RepID=UPI00379C186E
MERVRALEAVYARRAALTPYDQLPEPPTARQLRDATAAALAAPRSGSDALAGLLLAADRDGDPAVLAEAERLLADADARLWTALDTAVRRAWGGAPHRSAATARRLADGVSPPVGLVLAACHPNGHVRETAVARLAASTGAPGLPVLALRAAEWVRPVRERARSALARRLAAPSGDVVVAVAGVALALRERGEGRWLADRVEAVLRAGPPGVLEAALVAPDTRIRRAAYGIALDTGQLALAGALCAARYDADPVIRVRCAEAAVRAAAAAGTPGLVRPLLSSGTAAVRAAAVWAQAVAGDPSPAVAALADRSPIVRAVAQAAARRHGTDPATRYRILAAAPGPAPGAVAGLGETGSAADADLLRPWLAHPLPRGRAEAVRALRRLGAADPAVLTGLLTDPSGAVVRQVTRALHPHASGVDAEHLRDLLASTRPGHVRTAAYRLLRERDTATRLLTDLGLLTDPLPALRARARNDVREWLAHDAATAYAAPPPAVAAALAARLPDAEAVFGPDVTRLLRFHLGIGRVGA